jgi:cytidylate kinase
VFVAEGLAKTLKYHLVSREEMLQETAKYGVAKPVLDRFLLGPPTFSDEFKHELRQNLSFVQAAICEWAQRDNVIFLGNVDHLLLKGVSHVLRIRLIAPMEFRIRIAVDRGEIEREQAAAYIEKADAQRRAWILFLYGVDSLNPNLYDLTINLENMDVESAVEIAAAASRCQKFSPTALSRKAMEDLLLASRVKAALASEPLVAPLEINVQADSSSASVLLAGKLPSSLIEPVVDIASKTPGVAKVNKSLLEKS